MRFSVASFLDRWSRALIVGSVIHAAATAVPLFTGWGGEALAEWISAWGNFPLMGVFLLMMWPLLRDESLSPRRRRAFQLMFAAQILDTVASIGWGYSVLTTSETWGAWPDVIWIAWYPLAATAFGLLYVELGGRLNTTRALIDFGTITVGFGALLWFTALAPLTRMNGAQLAENWSALTYGIGNGVGIIAAAMVAMQITGWRAERAITWLVIAMVCTLVADLLWVSAELNGQYEAGALIDLVYPVYYIAAILAANAQRHERTNTNVPTRAREVCRAICADRCPSSRSWSA
jgi:hypothetical protein